MAKTNLGGVFTTDTDGNLASSVLASTENVVGMVFDTKIVGGLAAALGDGTAATTFAGGNVVELNDPRDLQVVGLDENVMGGLPQYHIRQFFQLAGPGQRLFVSFMDSTDDANFEAVENMQNSAGGIIYQIGVWTGEPIATVNDGNYVLNSQGVIAKLQDVAETLGGKIGETNFEGNAPLNILLNAPIVNNAACDYKKLPDLSALNASKVSFLIGQAATEDCHKIQLAVNSIKSDMTFALVGNIGAALACLAVAPANESIAHVASFNLANAFTEAELGFGDLSHSESGWEASASWTNIKTLGYIKRNNYLHKKGYIFLTNYDNLENAIFFSSDQTLTDGDYRTIARCRVMHKARRVVRRALLPTVNANVEVDTTTGTISASDISNYQNIVLAALDTNMVEPGTRVPQISGRTCDIDEDQNILENDQLLINFSLIPLGTTSIIHVTEGFSATE